MTFEEYVRVTPLDAREITVTTVDGQRIIGYYGGDLHKRFLRLTDVEDHSVLIESVRVVDISDGWILPPLHE